MERCVSGRRARERTARNNPQKAEPGEKAKERAEERAKRAADAEAAANAPAEEPAPADNPPTLSNRCKKFRRGAYWLDIRNFSSLE